MPVKKVSLFSQAPVTISALIVIVLAGVFIAVVHYSSLWFFSHVMEDSRDVPGDATRVDPIAVLSDVQAYAGQQAKLVSIEAQAVRTDGTLNLTETYVPGPTVKYEFIAPTEAKTATPPPGVLAPTIDVNKKKITIVLSRPGERRRVTKTGVSSRSSYQYVNDGMKRTESASGVSREEGELQPPRCAFADLWNVVLQQHQEITPDTVARITYKRNQYQFQITGTAIDLSFSADCRLETK